MGCDRPRPAELQPSGTQGPGSASGDGQRHGGRAALLSPACAPDQPACTASSGGSALEAYAGQVAEADARYAEVREIERLAAGRDELLDLLARTMADDLAAAEIDALTDEAAVVASTFAKALESAKQAAAAAIPLQGTA